MNILYSKYHIILFISGLLCSSDMYSQYVGPEHRTLNFRIYGKNAKPISENDKDYKVNATVNGYNKQSKKRELGYSYGFNNGEFYINITEFYSTDKPATIIIINKKDSMILSSSESMDSVSFTPGKYCIPPEYGPLFLIHPDNSTRIINQDLSYFKCVDDTTSPIKLFKYSNSISFEKLIKWVLLPESKTLAAIGERKYEYFFLYSNNNGNSWNSKAIAGFEEKQKINTLIAKDDLHFYLLGYDDNKKMNITWSIDNSGRTSIDSLLTLIQAYSLYFVTPNIGFALSLSEDKLSRFYRTVDGGKHWELMYNGMKVNNASILYFKDSSIGYIRVNDSKTENYFRTMNAGKTWDKYNMLSKINSPDDKNIIGWYKGYYGNEHAYYFTPQKANELYKVSNSLNGIHASKILFNDKKTGVIINANYCLITKNGGESWTYFPFAIYFPDNKSCDRIYVRDAEFVSSNKMLLYTYNEIYLVSIEE